MSSKYQIKWVKFVFVFQGLNSYLFQEIMSGFVRAARIFSMMFQIMGEIVEVSYHSDIIVTQFRKVRIASKSDIHQEN